MSSEKALSKKFEYLHTSLKEDEKMEKKPKAASD